MQIHPRSEHSWSPSPRPRHWWTGSIGSLSDFVSSDLLETELRRMAVREGRDQATVSAIRLDVDAVLTYDHRLAEAAKSAGLDVIAPGAGATT